MKIREYDTILQESRTPTTRWRTPQSLLLWTNGLTDRPDVTQIVRATTVLRTLSSILALEPRADVTGIQIKDTGHVKLFQHLKKNKEKIFKVTTSQLLPNMPPIGKEWSPICMFYLLFTQMLLTDLVKQETITFIHLPTIYRKSSWKNHLTKYCLSLIRSWR